MPDIIEIVDQFRADLLLRERRAATEIVRAYGAVWRDIKPHVDALDEQIAQARARGEDVSPAWLLQFRRLESLQRQIEVEVRRVADLVDQVVTREQAEVIEAARRHAAQLVAARLGQPPSPEVSVSFSQLPTQAFVDLVGVLQDGSPLRDLLDALGTDASRRVQQRLLVGVATGLNPVEVARQIREALGGNLARALTIARTEVLRSYRTASLRTYRANPDVVKAWTWRSAADRRTCAFCWARHGSVHSVDEPFASHPRCRCSPVPVTRSWRELGITTAPDTEPLEPTGPELFARLPVHEQRAILGPAKYEAYSTGRITLQDLIGIRRDPRWGPVGYERSLAAALQVAEQRRTQQPQPEPVKPRPVKPEPPQPAPQPTPQPAPRPRPKSQSQPKATAQTKREEPPLPKDPFLASIYRSARVIRDTLEDVLGLSSNWNGQITIDKNVEYNGVKQWSCSIGLRDSIAQNRTRMFKTLTHEMLHSVSVGVTVQTMISRIGWEEGVVEAMSRILVHEAAARANVSLDKTMLALAIAMNGYNKYIAALERARNAMNMDEREFYTTLIRTPIVERPEWVRRQLGKRNASLFREVHRVLIGPR